jgi:hypothetical protein
MTIAVPSFPAITGFALRELPGHIRARQIEEPRPILPRPASNIASLHRTA